MTSTTFALVLIDPKTSLMRRYECSHGSDSDGRRASTKRFTHDGQITMVGDDTANVIDHWRRHPDHFYAVQEEPLDTNPGITTPTEA